MEDLLPSSPKLQSNCVIGCSKQCAVALNERLVLSDPRTNELLMRY